MLRSQRITRRRFVKGAAAAIAAPYVIPASALGLDGAVAPSNRITLGFIGTGDHGVNWNMRYFFKQPDAQIVAVCDVDSARREDAKKKVEEHYAEALSKGTYKGCASHNDFREIIARKDIDAVMISTPDHWHVIPALMAVRAGKDVECEKPLTLTVAEGRALADAVKKHNRIFQTSSENRSVDVYHRMCELVRNGRIGKLKHINVTLPRGHSIRAASMEVCPPPAGFDYNMWLGQTPEAPYCPARCHWNFRWILDYSGGQLTDWAAHHVDIADWGLGTEHTGPIEVEGKGEFPRDGLWNASTSYRFECVYREGFTMVVLNDKQEVEGKPFKNGVKFIGDKGWLWVARGNEIASEPESVINDMAGPNEVHLYRSNNHWGNFIECVRSRKETIAPIEPAQRAITVAHLGNIAMQLERKVKWDPARERFVDDPEADRMIDRAMRSPWRL